MRQQYNSILRDFNQKLQKRHDSTDLYTQKLEAAYKKMYEIYSSDMPPESFCV
jgi:hypothetical protein